MTTRRLEVVCFDLWDTLVVDDSDEIERERRGLRTKREERRHLLWQALEEVGPTPREEVFRAYDHGDTAFNRAWHDQHVTWPIRERLERILEVLGRDLDEPALAEVVRAHEEMEVEIYPDAITGCREALAELSSRYRLAVVSDAIVSPGRCLRKLLELHELAPYFSAHAFSDEVGRSKPHPAMFEFVSRQLGVEPSAMVHVGDREHNDVQGAQQLGMKAVMFVASRDRDRAGSQADAICDSYDELPRIIDRLNEETP